MALTRLRLQIALCCVMLLASSSALAQSTRQVLFSAAEGTGFAGIAVLYDDTLYGALSSGGTHNLGTLVRRTADGQVSVLHAFRGSDGAQPLAAPIFGENGELYGTTSSGGDHGYGTLFRVAASGELSVLHHFTLDEGGPVRVPLTRTSDGRLLGVTSGVYTVDCFPLYDCHLALQRNGKIFELQADESIKVLYDGILNPGGAIFEASDGALYGARAIVTDNTIDGSGIFSHGSIYRLHPDGSVNFEGLHLPGFDPRGDLIESIDGYLLSASAGAVIRMTLGPDDTVPQLSIVAQADMAPGGLALGSDGHLYGGQSSFTRVRLDGHVAQLRLFDNLIKPPSAAIRADSCATGFFVPSGDDLNHLRMDGSATTLHRFGYQNGRQLEHNSLVITREGDVYGTTSLGGAYDSGTLFKLSSSGVLSAVYHFPVGSTQYPSRLRTPLVAADDGALYAVTYESSPRLVRVDPALSEGSSTVLTTLHVFDAPAGWPTVQPDSLIAGHDGFLYGVTEAPPEGPFGEIKRLIYRFDLATQQLQSFGTYEDVGPLLAAADGVYGNSGTAQDNGCTSYSYELFRLTPDGAREVLHAFPTDPNGYIPMSSLAEGPDGAIYGVANGRTEEVARVVYRWTAASGFEHFATLSQISEPYDYRYIRQVAIGQHGELYITNKNEVDAPTQVVLADKSVRDLPFSPQLGVITDPGRGIYRILPFERDGYSGFTLVPVTLP